MLGYLEIDNNEIGNRRATGVVSISVLLALGFNYNEIDNPWQILVETCPVWGLYPMTI